MNRLSQFFKHFGFEMPWWDKDSSPSSTIKIEVDRQIEDLSIKDNALLELKDFCMKIFKKPKCMLSMPYQPIQLDIGELQQLEWHNALQLSAKPRTSIMHRRLSNVYSFLMYIRSVKFINEHKDVDYSDEYAYELYKKALIADDNAGCLDIYWPSLQAIANSMPSKDFVFTDDFSQLKRMLHEKLIAIAEVDAVSQLYDDSISINEIADAGKKHSQIVAIFGFNEDFVFGFTYCKDCTCKFFGISSNAFQQIFHKGASIL